MDCPNESVMEHVFAAIDGAPGASLAERKFLRRYLVECAAGGALAAKHTMPHSDRLQMLLDGTGMTLPRLLKALRSKQAGHLASRIGQLSKPRNVDAHPVSLEAVLAVLGGSGSSSDASGPCGSSCDGANLAGSARPGVGGSGVHCGRHDTSNVQLHARVANLETKLGEVVFYLQHVPVMGFTSRPESGAAEANAGKADGHYDIFTDSDPGDLGDVESQPDDGDAAGGPALDSEKATAKEDKQLATL